VRCRIKLRNFIISVLIISFSAVATVLACTATANSQADSHTPHTSTHAVVAFVDVNVVPMDRDIVLAHQTIIVRNGRIAVIGAVHGTMIPHGATVINGKGTEYLMPGLADMHTHADEPDDLLLYVANGVTTVLVFPPTVGWTQARFFIGTNPGDLRITSELPVRRNPGTVLDC
jgi:hypothetical protein